MTMKRTKSLELWGLVNEIREANGLPELLLGDWSDLKEELYKAILEKYARSREEIFDEFYNRH